MRDFDEHISGQKHTNENANGGADQAQHELNVGNEHGGDERHADDEQCDAPKPRLGNVIGARRQRLVVRRMHLSKK